MNDSGATRVESRLETTHETVAPNARALSYTPREMSASATKLRILLVEDSEILRETLQALVEDLGHTVTTAKDGLGAVAEFSQAEFDVVLIDVGLPDIDGYDVAKRMRASLAGKKMRLVAMTGRAQPSDKVDALNAGFDDHLAKPFEIEELSALLRQR